MSYVRWGVEGSDVYVYRRTDGKIECHHADGEHFYADDVGEMIRHLRAHQADGDCVPDFAFESLRRGWE